MKKQSKNYNLNILFNPKYNYILIIIKKDGKIGCMGKSENYNNIQKQLLFAENNYAYLNEVEKFVIDELI